MVGIFSNLIIGTFDSRLSTPVLITGLGYCVEFSGKKLSYS